MPSTKAQNEWIKANRILKAVNLSKLTDQDIIQHIATKPSFQGYVKQLIREDIQREQQTNK